MNTPATGNMRLVIVGATGMVGAYVLGHALADPSVGHVTSIGRRKTGISHPKLVEDHRLPLRPSEPLYLTSRHVATLLEILELQPKGELHNAISAITVDAGQLSKGTPGDVEGFRWRTASRQGEVWMIERIEGISPKLQIHPIGNQGEDLGKAEVLIVEIRPTKDVSTSNGESDGASKVALCPDWIGKKIYLARRGFMYMRLYAYAVAIEDGRSIVRVASHKCIRVGAERSAGMPL